MKKLFILILAIITVNAHSQTAVNGAWSGKIFVTGLTLSINVNLSSETNSGTIDIIEQNAKNLLLNNIKQKAGKISFELPAGKTTAYFEGKIIGDSIGGTFKQAGTEGTFYLLRNRQTNEIKQEELPYNSEEVTFYNGTITLAGTLTTPKIQGKHPALVMITGSGPQNRDEEIFGFKIFGIIADYLTRNGIAVLRYDDRGVGGSTANNESTTDDFAGDVIEAVKFLRTRSDINPEQVGLFGHSEGGIIAPLAFTKYDKIAFMVLMAGTGVKGIDIIKEQSKLIMKADSAADDEVKGYMAMLDLIYETVKKNTGWDELKEQIKQNIEENYDKIPEETKKYIKDKDEYINSQAGSTIKQFKSNWMRYFLDYDPSIALANVTCPVLMLFGSNDLQVPPAQNEKPMTDALTKAGNNDFTVKIIPKANHLFQESVTGSPTEYTTLKKEFIPGFLDTITEWVLQRVKVIK